MSENKNRKQFDLLIKQYRREHNARRNNTDLSDDEIIDCLSRDSGKMPYFGIIFDESERLRSCKRKTQFGVSFHALSHIKKNSKPSDYKKGTTIMPLVLPIDDKDLQITQISHGFWITNRTIKVDRWIDINKLWEK